MSTEITTAHIDGAARGNPGPAAYAFVLEPPSGTPIEQFGVLGQTTNNVAEYTALLRMLEHASTLGLRHLIVHSDSELLVKQMNGEYRVKNSELRELYEEARSLLKHFASVQIRHVRREQNKRADALCNLALDGGTQKPKAAKQPARQEATTGMDGLREDAIALLDSVRAVWHARDPAAPTAEQVWDQLWSLIEPEIAPRKKKR